MTASIANLFQQFEANYELAIASRFETDAEDQSSYDWVLNAVPYPPGHYLRLQNLEDIGVQIELEKSEMEKQEVVSVSKDDFRQQIDKLICEEKGKLEEARRELQEITQDSSSFMGLLLGGFKAAMLSNMVSGTQKRIDTYELWQRKVRLPLKEWQSITFEAGGHNMTTVMRSENAKLYVSFTGYKVKSDGSINFLSLSYTGELKFNVPKKHWDADGGIKAGKAILSLGIWNLVDHFQDKDNEEKELESIRRFCTAENIAYHIVRKASPAFRNAHVNLDVERCTSSRSLQGETCRQQ